MPLKSAAPDGYQFYWTADERSKSARRTLEWTVPQLQRFGIVPPAKILSAGCGNGQDVLTLREKGYATFGVDIAFNGYPGRYFATASGSCLPFATGFFDAVISLEVIEHVDFDGRGNRKRYSQELQRVTKPGGLIVLATPNRYFPIDEHGEPIRIHSPFESGTLSYRELRDLFSQCSAYPLKPSKYFAFRRFARIAGEWCPLVLESVSNFLASKALQASPLNPHLYVGFVKKQSELQTI